MAAKIFRINYKSDFILTLNSDAGWMTPFCIKFWTGAPSQAFFVGWDGETYTHCAYDPSEPTKLLVQFDDHHLPIGDLKFQIAYHFTVADFPNDTEDEVINPANITTEIDGETYQVMLDFTGETAPEIEFSLPAYANEVQRIENEQQRIAAETQRIANEETRISNEQTRVAQEQTRQQNEAQRIAQESARVSEFASLKSASEAATRDANNAATLANEKAQLADDKAALADRAATQASINAVYAHDEGQLAGQKAIEAAQATQLATNEAAFAHDQGTYAKNQGDYAKAQGDTALADHVRANADHSTAVDDHTKASNDHTRAESDHSTSAADHTTAGNDHTLAESDHGIAVDDHTQAAADHTTASADHTTAGNDHTRAESDHTRAESDHDAVELYVDSLGVFDLSKHNAVGGVLATYADLGAALTALNTLDSQYKYGGMSFKFVLSSDHKYVQFRYMLQYEDATSGNQAFVNTDNWAVCDDGIYAKNPEFVRVETDENDNILWAIKADGSFYFGDGCPPQVKGYVLAHKQEILAELATKVDKVEGKGLSTNDYTNGEKEVVDCGTLAKNPKYLQVTTDSEDNILEGIRDDGTKVIEIPTEEQGVRREIVNSPEFIQVTTDNDGRIIEGIKKDGKKVFYAGIESPTITQLKKPWLPDYYTETYLSAMINGINAQTNVSRGFSMVFFTDIHFGNNQHGNSKYLIQLILDNTSVPFAVFGGDIPWAYGTEEALNKAISDYREYQKIIGKDRLYSVRGNHDLGITDSNLSIDYRKSFGEVNSLLSINNGWRHKVLPMHLCTILENEFEKIRVLLLNSQDKQDDEYLWGNRNYISSEQMGWLVNDVLNDEGYKYVIVSHIPSDSELTGYHASQTDLQNLLLAVKNKESFTCTIDGVTISKNFSTTTNDIVCHIMGHSHVDESHVERNLLSITTTCDCCSGAGRIGGTVTEQAFDVFTFDLENEKINAYRVGGGESREWNI